MEKHQLERLIESYLLEKNFSSATVKSYKIVFKYYIIYLKENYIEYAKTSDIIQYRESRRSLGYSTHYIYVHMSALKGLYRYLRINQKSLNLPTQYDYDIMVPIKNERIKASIKKPILTLDQARHIILHTKNTRKYIWHYRDHAIIYLMMTSGLRRIEIVHAKREDYQIVDEQWLLYINKKGRKSDEEFVKISKGAGIALNEYLNIRKDDHPYLFISHRSVSNKGHLSRTFFYDMFPRVLKDCGLDGLGITPHCLRHSAATFNLLRGDSIEATKSLMRHVNIQSTLVYANHIERMKDDSELQIEKFILKEDSFIQKYFDLFSYLSNENKRDGI